MAAMSRERQPPVSRRFRNLNWFRECGGEERGVSGLSIFQTVLVVRAPCPVSENSRILECRMQYCTVRVTHRAMHRPPGPRLRPRLDRP